MTSSEDIDAVERIFDYRFKSKHLLLEALTAAGIEDGENYDGHGRLAQIGVDIIGICVAFDGFQTKSSPHLTAALKQGLRSYEHRVHVAQRTTIDKYVTYNPKPGGKCPKVAAKALAAIIAAIYLDCGSHEITWEKLQYIGFTVRKDDGVNPAFLESQANGEIFGLPTVVSSLSQDGGSLPVNAGLLSSAGTVVGPSQSFVSGLECTALGETFSSGDLQVSHNPSAGNQAARPFGTETESTGIKQPPKSNWDRFLCGESQKSRARGLPSPEESYFDPSVQMQILELKGERSIEVSKRLLLLIASSQSVVILQEALRSWRSPLGTSFCQPSHLISKAATFDIIEDINRDIACLHLVRRYYILSLFEECGGSETPSFSGFVEISGNPDAVKRLKGNPRNRAEAEVTAAMLKEIFPNLQEGTREYEKKSTLVKYYRQIARRFSSLTRQFGRGILALMPYHEVQGEPDLSISDNMISRIAEPTFLTIVSILEKSQGDILRNFSTAAMKFVEALLFDSAQQCPIFALETTETSRILEQPKNSLELLGCLM